jgi:O-antigen/teichoic acid export membrane protein
MFSKSLVLILLQRFWQALAGIVTIFFVARCLTPDQQGWYYTFISVASLYSVFEMGLSAAILQIAAQMFVKLHWLNGGRVDGEGGAEFRSFHFASLRIYAVVSIIFFLTALILGGGVFEHRANLSVPRAVWMLPWIALVVLTAANMLMLPFLAVVEGSGEIVEVYKVRFIQGFLGAILCWLILDLGGWLWSTVAMPLAGFTVACCWLLWKRRALIEIDRGLPKGKRYDWVSKIWPHQWRLGINWVSVFFMSQVATPILFYYFDPVVAGRMGLSLTIVHMLGVVSQSWIAQRVPTMSQAVVRREWHILDHFFKRDLLHSLAFFMMGAFLIILCYKLLENTQYIQRVLPFWQFVGLMAFVFFYHINGALSAQLRSYRREPLVWVFMIGALIILSGSLIGASFGSVGSVVFVMFGVQAFFIFPLSFMLWRRYNRILRIEPSDL